MLATLYTTLYKSITFTIVVYNNKSFMCKKDSQVYEI